MSSLRGTAPIELVVAAGFQQGRFGIVFFEKCPRYFLCSIATLIAAITSPEVAIYMAKVGNSYGHPHAETVTALKQIDAQIYGTDVNGTIIVTTDGRTYLVSPESV